MGGAAGVAAWREDARKRSASESVFMSSIIRAWGADARVHEIRRARV